MDDINENQFGNQDDFEFEKYPDENDSIEPSNAIPPLGSDDGYKEDNPDSFKEYSDDENSGVFVPVPPMQGEAGHFGENEDDDETKQDNVNVVPVIPISPQEKARKAAKRAKLREEKRKKEEEKEKRRRNMKVTMIVFGIILFIMWICYFALTNMMPEHLMNQGKKYLEVKEYQKALRLFNMVSDTKPYDDEPVYYKAVTLSRMPLTYENQKALYEISQLDNYDKASEYADAVLSGIKQQIDKKVGSNYIDNVLYEDILFRWNTKEPITYFISNNSNATQEYIDTVKKAFALWSGASNGEITFREVVSPGGADIVVNMLNNLASSNNSNDANRSGIVNPVIKNNTLQKVEIELGTNYPNGSLYNINGFRAVAQHEIGHALGIWGHSSNPDDIMYYSGDYISQVNPNKGFSKRDVNTLTLLYKMAPDVINTPIDPKDYDNLFYHYVITTVPGEDFELEMQRLLANLHQNTRNVPGWVDLAINYGIKKQYQRSNTILKSILPLTKNDIQNQFVVLYNMAANSYKMKEYKATEKLLYMATRYHEDVDTQMLEAFTDLKLKKKELGKGKLVILNERYPENIEIALKLAQVYYFDKEKVKAKEVIDNLIKINPDSLRDRRVLKYRAFNAKHIKDNEKDKTITVTK